MAETLSSKQIYYVNLKLRATEPARKILVTIGSGSATVCGNKLSTTSGQNNVITDIHLLLLFECSVITVLYVTRVQYT